MAESKSQWLPHANTLLILLLALAAMACGGSQEGGGEAESQEAAAEAPHSTDTAHVAEIQKLAELANAIEAAPENAAELLRAASMTMEQFEAEIYRISADPDLSRAYEAAREALKH